MIARLKLQLPSERGPFLDRVMIWSGALLIISIAAFATYYYFDQGSSSYPGAESRLERLSAYEQAARDYPNNLGNRLVLGEAYRVLERFEESALQFEAALIIDDKSTIAFVGLGRAKIGLGDLDGAAENFQNVIDMFAEEDVPGNLVEASYYFLGSIALEQQQPDEAIEYLQKAVGLERSDADAWHLLGTAYLQSGNVDEAIAALSQAVLFVPEYAEAYDKLALAYDQKGATGEALYARGMMAYGMGQLDEAAEQLEAASMTVPTMAEVFAGLGMVREIQGQADEAAAAYQKALEIDPNNYIAVGGAGRLTQASSAAELPAGHPAAPDEETP